MMMFLYFFKGFPNTKEEHETLNDGSVSCHINIPSDLELSCIVVHFLLIVKGKFNIS